MRTDQGTSPIAVVATAIGELVPTTSATSFS